MKTFQVEVTQIVTVVVDETKFDEAFMEEFRASFYQFDTLEEHVEHLAQLEARGLIDVFGERFIEGYGPADEMGIKTSSEVDEIDILTGAS